MCPIGNSSETIPRSFVAFASGRVLPARVAVFDSSTAPRIMPVGWPVGSAKSADAKLRSPKVKSRYPFLGSLAMINSSFFCTLLERDFLFLAARLAVQYTLHTPTRIFVHH